MPWASINAATGATAPAPVSQTVSDLGLRVVSAVVLAPLVLLALYAGWPYADALLVVAGTIMAWETARMLAPRRSRGLEWLTPGCIALALTLVVFGQPAGGFALVVVAALALAAGLRTANGILLGSFLVYLTTGCLAFIWLRQLPEFGLAAIAVLLASVWATDIGAYFTGRSLGGPKLAPRLSPKKTWSGLLGGMVGAGVAAGLVAWGLPGTEQVLNGAGSPAFVALGAALAVISQAGDLLESALKRYAGVKDASNLIPGHGGVLDRADGLLSASPALALVIWLIHQGV